MQLGISREVQRGSGLGRRAVGEAGRSRDTKGPHGGKWGSEETLGNKGERVSIGKEI